MKEYFKDSEFDSPDAPGSGKHIDPVLRLVCNRVREEYGRPVFINSGVRTEEHNKKVGGKKASAHLIKGVYGKAVDIRCNNSVLRWIILKVCVMYGIKRIGIAKNFIHIDSDKGLPKEVVWTYRDSHGNCCSCFASPSSASPKDKK